jgi:ABC-2 type transport system permease protein
MNKLLLVIQREYLSKVRKKSFIIMTLLTPLLMTSIFVIPSLLAMNNHTQSQVAVIDQNPLNQINLENNDNVNFQYLNELNFEDNKFILLDTYDMILLIPKVDSMIQLEQQLSIFSKHQISLSVKTMIENQIDNHLSKQQLFILGINPQLIQKAQTKTTIQTYVVDEKGSDTLGHSETSFGIGLIGGFLIYIFIFMYGTMVMRSIIEEKTSRIVEIIVSSVKPFQLMLGKIISIALVGLTQFALWLILGFGFLLIVNGYMSSEEISQMSQSDTQIIEDISSSLVHFPVKQLIISFILYFLGGYLLYGSLFAAIGSVSDQETDSQQFIFPITIPLILSFIFVQFVIDQPHSGLAYWLSMIPFTSPIIMMARIPFGVPTIQIVCSVIVLIIGFLLTTFLAAKIYRTGILMYGKKISYKELWKWINYKN